MKLAEMLAKELEEWPEGVGCYAQDWDSCCYGWTTAELYNENGLWYSGKGCVVEAIGVRILADDYDTAIVTKEMWEVARKELYRESTEDTPIGQTPNSNGYQTEGLQTVSILLDVLESRLGVAGEGVHPSVWNEKCEKHLKKATKHLCRLYQEMGVWECLK